MQQYKMAGNEDEAIESKRVFVNYCDTYQGKNVAKYLSQCVVGASLDEIEEEEEETGSVASGDMDRKTKEGCYQVISSFLDREKDKIRDKPSFVKEILQYRNREQLLEHLIECDMIVYDITEQPEIIDEAIWVVSELHADLDRLEKPKMFVLISSAMTWANSKPLDPDDTEIPFTEEDYRRRRAHPNWKDHINAEKTVIKLGKTNKSKLATYVIASGLTYGAEENIFHYLFKAAWHNAEHLHVFGAGQNCIPTIHIRDLAAVIQNILDSRPKIRYLIAADDSKHTLEEIVKAVSKALGTGKIKHIAKEDALLSKDIQQADFDQLLVNLRMDGVFIRENMHIRWASETGILENIDTIVREYRESRALQPLRILIHGPPCSGKSTIASQLCKHYKLHHIKIADVIAESKERLKKSAARAQIDEAEEEEDDGTAAEDEELLAAIDEDEKTNDGRISDEYILRLVKQTLKSVRCQNQGFILDGFPKTIDQTKDLFANEDEDAEEETGAIKYDKTITPEFVISLQADDEFLRNRVMNLPESVVVQNHTDEKGLLRRLKTFLETNGDDVTMLNFFEENEIHAETIDITQDKTIDNKMIISRILKKVGEPRNYGPTQDEIEEKKRREEEERLKKEEEDKRERERQEKEEAAERKRRQDEWTERLNDVKRQEHEMLETQSIPLRNYLMKHVMPTLTQGLIDACKVRPDDPIDFLVNEFYIRINSMARICGLSSLLFLFFRPSTCSITIRK
ncbi:DgyrCDS10516 [Dimorphilus gyrociliatus]|uniref:DgyrCDS10516 n=1 Tax=Dimorphilus gyrociliatus TaxID=2664684 RepID=A0A7I8W5J2_9ANNE|nr:DgyrCDS10516 [Dimorphilus gyrociliatus]